MNTQEKNYRKQVRKALLCGRKEKQQLTAALDRDLARFREETPEPTAEELSAAFGTPEDMAASLMAQLPEGTQKKFQKCKRVWKWIVSAVIIFLIAFFAFVAYTKEIPVKAVDDVDINGTEYVPDRTSDEE